MVPTQKYWPSLSITVKVKTKPKINKIPRKVKRNSKDRILHKSRKPPLLVMDQLFQGTTKWQLLYHEVGDRIDEAKIEIDKVAAFTKESDGTNRGLFKLPL